MSKIAVIGGGYSGVIASIYASKNNNITILERNDKLLKKLLITGNGRCNYFNSDMNLNHFHSYKDKYIKDIITKNNIDEINKFYKKLGLVYRIKNGYYYPFSNQASSIRDLLLNEIIKNNIDVKYNYFVNDIKKENDKFIINNELYFDKIIISTGSKAYPKTGSNGEGYKLLKKLNHNITKISPSLVQIESNNKYLKDLNGIRCEANLSLYDNNKIIKEEKGELQFTNYGISGICTFNLTPYLKDNITNKYILINFMPIDKDELIKLFNNNKIGIALEGILNYKLVNILLKIVKIDKNSYYNKLDDIKKNNLLDILYQYRLGVTGTKDFNYSQVCAGGVDLDDININTMESKIVNNLYITGELLDLDGDCGGYNLTIAFITGYLAGVNI